MRLDSKVTRVAEASPEAIADAAACLRAGGLVAMPTETVYGLAADATSDAAVAAIYAAKERPAINPLISHVLDIEAARGQAIFGLEAETLARAFWPGPLTLVLPVASTCRISLWRAPALRRSRFARLRTKRLARLSGRPASPSRRPRPTDPAP